MGSLREGSALGHIDLRSRIMLRPGDGRETKLMPSFGVGKPKPLSTEDFMWD